MSKKLLATPTRAPPCATTALASHSTGTPPTSCRPSSPPHRANQKCPLRARQNERGAGIRRYVHCRPRTVPSRSGVVSRWLVGARGGSEWRYGMSGGWGGRSRWASLGAVVGVLVGGGGLLTASAAGSPQASSLILIAPCRLLDTRAGNDNIGPRSTPLGPDEAYVAAVWGSNGHCLIPDG